MKAHVLIRALAVIMAYAFLIFPCTGWSENFYRWQDAQGKAWISNVDFPAGAEATRITFPEQSPARANSSPEVSAIREPETVQHALAQKLWRRSDAVEKVARNVPEESIERWEDQRFLVQGPLKPAVLEEVLPPSYAIPNVPPYLLEWQADSLESVANKRHERAFTQEVAKEATGFFALQGLRMAISPLVSDGEPAPQTQNPGAGGRNIAAFGSFSRSQEVSNPDHSDRLRKRLRAVNQELSETYRLADYFHERRKAYLHPQLTQAHLAYNPDRRPGSFTEMVEFLWQEPSPDDPSYAFLDDGMSEYGLRLAEKAERANDRLGVLQSQMGTAGR